MASIHEPFMSRPNMTWDEVRFMVWFIAMLPIAIAAVLWARLTGEDICA